MKKIALFIIASFFVLLSFSGRLAYSATITPTYDNDTQSVDGGAERSSASFSHTTSGSDRLMIVFVHMLEQGTDPDVTAISYDGTSMLSNKIGEDQYTYGCGGPTCYLEVQAYYLPNPSTGSNTVSVTYNTTLSADGISAATYTNVDTSSPIGASATAASSGSWKQVDVTTTTTNSMIVGSQGTRGADTDPFSPGSGTTERWDLDTGGGSAVSDIGFSGGEEEAATIDTYTFDFTGGADYWVILAAEVMGKQEVPTNTPTPTPTPAPQTTATPTPTESVTPTPTPTLTPTPTPGGFTCTQVIGYSQVGAANGWYRAGGVFESVVDDGKWQLLWENGGSVDLWADPDYSGWDNQIVSPCTANSSTPDRVVFSTSGRYGDNEQAWADAINNAVSTIRDEIPSAQEIVLQPVVGGPNHESCYLPDTGEIIRASWQHKHIDNAIGMVVGDDVSAGYSPEVRVCGDYDDRVGHLTSEGGQAAGQVIGEYYAAETPDIEGPSVSITNPQDGETVSGSVSLDASSSDNIGVWNTHFYVDDTYSGSDYAAPYSILLDTTVFYDGQHVLKVTASDGFLNKVSTSILVTVDNGAPQTPTRIEAEDMTLTNYRILSGSRFGLSTDIISLFRTRYNSGIASTFFSGPPGNYDVLVAYFDETDGQSQFEARIGGFVVDSWVANQDIYSSRPSANNRIERTVAENIYLDATTLIEVYGVANSSEQANVDYLEFLPK